MTVQDTGELLPGHAAFHLFVCASKNNQQIRLPCDNHLMARTSATRMELMMSWIDANMSFVSIDDETTIRVGPHIKIPPSLGLIPACLGFCQFGCRSLQHDSGRNRPKEIAVQHLDQFFVGERGRQSLSRASYLQ